MPIDIACPSCKKPLRVADEYAGQPVRCPHCQQPMRAPQPAAPPPPALEPTPATQPVASPPPEPEPLIAAELAPDPEPEPLPVAELAEDEPPQRARKQRREQADEEPPPRPKKPRRDTLDEDVREVQQRERQSDTVKPIPARLAKKAKDLGRPVYHINHTFNYRLVAIIPAVIAVGLAALFLMAFAYGGGFREKRPLPPFVYVVPSIVAFIAFAVAVLAQKKIDEVWICPGGLAWHKGKDLGCAPWEDVRFFQPKVTTFITQEQASRVGGRKDGYLVYNCVIGFKGQREFTFEGQDEVAFLQRQVLKSLCPVYHERLDQGERVRIAPFDLTAKGLTYEGERAAWGEIADAYVANNKLRVDATDGRTLFRVPLEEVDMAVVLIGLTQQLAASARPAAPPSRPGKKQPPAAPQPERNPFDFG